MARKKRGKRVIRKKTSARSKTSKNPKKGRIFSALKIRLVVKNLIALIILTVISYLLYLISEKELYMTFFSFAYAILGSISLALFIVLLILLFLKSMKK